MSSDKEEQNPPNDTPAKSDSNSVKTANSSDGGASSVQVLMTLSRKSNSSASSKKFSNEDRQQNVPSSASAEFDSNSAETAIVPDTILCVLWKSGSLGAAYFNIITQQKLLVKIRNVKGSTNDWELLYKTIYNALFLYEQSMPYKSSVLLFADLEESITANLYALESCLRDTLDLTCRHHKARPSINFGVDDELDAKKLRRGDMGEHLTAAAQLTMNHLPDILTECTVVYIPEMGHLLVTKKNDQLTEPNQLEHLGFQFMFEINNTYHYKNAVCRELDKHLGTIQEDIIMHEIRITERVSNLVMKYHEDIRKPLQIISLIDCLIAMATVAKERSFVRPTLNTDNLIDIELGLHVLLGTQCDNIVPNDFKSGGEHSKVKVITGPNACGKSVYLKQTALLVYLAHVGSYIPAKSANISMVHSIHARIQVNESAAVHMSGFMIDLSQVSQILYNAKSNSLVIIDEFGKGTSGHDALALLAAALRKFLRESNACPHILVSTHMKQIQQHLPKTPLLSYHTFEYTHDTEEERIVFLYQLVQGISGSFALDVALAAGLNPDIVRRAREIHRAISEGRPVVLPYGGNQHRDAEYYFNINIPELDE